MWLYEGLETILDGWWCLGSCFGSTFDFFNKCEYLFIIFSPDLWLKYFHQVVESLFGTKRWVRLSLLYGSRTKISRVSAQVQFPNLLVLWKPVLEVCVRTPISASRWHLLRSLGIRSCQWALLLHTQPHSLHTLQELLKSLVLRVLCMIVTGRAWGLISAVSPSKALAVYSGLQGGRQGLSLPRHHAPATPVTPAPRESLQQGWQPIWAPHRKARLTGSRIWQSSLHESQQEKLNTAD